jgi:tetratricopeptide (TPR) repeat protein
MLEITPLFAVEAEEMLLAGFPEEAIELCKEGLEIYPDYPSALAVLAKANEAAGFRNEAELIIHSAKDNYYSRSIENISNQYDEYHIHVNFDDFLPEEIIEEQIPEDKIGELTVETIEEQIHEDHFDDFSVENLEIIEIENFDELNGNEEEIPGDSEAITELDKSFEYPAYSSTNLVDLHDNSNEFLSESDIEKNHETETEDKKGVLENPFLLKKFNKDTVKIDEISVKSKSLNINELISTHINLRLKITNISEPYFKSAKAKVVLTETMAEILTKQGSTQQAIDIYSKLAMNEPEKKQYFNQKIEQIRNSF